MRVRTKWRILNAASLLFSAGILINASNIEVESTILQRINIITLIVAFIAISCSVTNLYRRRSKFIATTGIVTSAIGLVTSLTLSELIQFPSSDISDIPWVIFGVLVAIAVPIVLCWAIRKDRGTRASNLLIAFVTSLSIFLILWFFVLPEMDYDRGVEAITLLILYIAEISGLLLLLFKFDSIPIYSNLRLWGLRLLAGILLICGMTLGVFLWVYSLFTFPFVEETAQTSYNMAFLAFAIPALGLMFIGGYLEFKFMRGCGVIIHRGLGWR